ncbi:Basic-leucine zipper domain-containing protein, partial [Cynara cardunculus var. scolymus]
MGSNGRRGGGSQPPKSDGLARQSSLYNLTLDEVQTQLGDLGKPLSSMNLDELLKSVWSAEANQGLNSGQADYSHHGQPASGSSLARQSSSINHQQAQWMHYQVPPIQPQHVYMTGHHPVQQSLSIGANAMMELAYPETQITMSPSHLMHNLSDTQTPGRKRVASGDVIEKTVERRQKRMIKNRESAARSRARKQAYTHELENKISRLEEENERLKRQKGRFCQVHRHPNQSTSSEEQAQRLSNTNSW